MVTSTPYWAIVYAYYKLNEKPNKTRISVHPSGIVTEKKPKTIEITAEEPLQPGIDIGRAEASGLLKSWRIAPEIRDNAINLHSKEELQKISLRLEAIVDDVSEFRRQVPWCFTYSGQSLDSYLLLLGEIMALVRKNFEDKPQLQLGWRDRPTAYKNTDSLIELKGLLESHRKSDAHLKPHTIETNYYGDDSDELLRIKRCLEAYKGKRILVVGVREVQQREALTESLSGAKSIKFLTGEDMRGIKEQIGSYEVIVLTAGVATHEVRCRLQAEYGDNYSRKVISAFRAVNPNKIVEAMARNARRFE